MAKKRRKDRDAKRPRGDSEGSPGRDAGAGASRAAASTEPPTVPTWLPPALFIGLTLLLFRTFVFGNEMLFGSDTLGLGYVARALYAESVHTFGAFPRWAPDILGGTPFLEALSAGDSFYPPSLFLLLVMEPFRALGFGGHDTASGEKPRILVSGDLRIGALVCYEIAFEALSVDLARSTVDLLVNLSNDGWFGRTGAIEQHFSSAVFRAIETGRPVLRATNTGVTAAVDAFGRVVARAPLLEPATLEVDVMLGGPSTLYVATGNWVGPACLAAALLLSALPTLLRWRQRTA